MSSVHTSAFWGDVVNHAQVPRLVVPSAVRMALSIASRNCLGAAVAKRHKPDSIRVHIAISAACRSRAAGPVVHDHLHFVVVIGGLAVDGDADAGLRVGQNPPISAFETSVSPFTPGSRRKAHAWR